MLGIRPEHFVEAGAGRLRPRRRGRRGRAPGRDQLPLRQHQGRAADRRARGTRHGGYRRPARRSRSRRPAPTSSMPRARSAPARGQTNRKETRHDRPTETPLGHPRPRHHRPRLRRRARPFATGTLVAIGARNPGKAGLRRALPRRPHPCRLRRAARRPGGRRGLHRDPAPEHAEWAIKAAEAGKHVLVEKPMGLTAYEADAIIHAARRAGTFMGEAFMYRLHPQTARLLELIRDGAIGEVRMIQSSFGFAMPRLRPGAPALRQRARRRRHPRRRLLPGVDGAADRRRGRGQAVPRARQGLRHGASRRERRRRMGRGAAAVPERHHRRVRLRGLAEAGERAAGPRHHRPHRGRRLLVRLRPRGRHRQDRRSSPPTAAAAPSRSRKRAGSIPSRSTPPARRSVPAGRSSPRRA